MNAGGPVLHQNILTVHLWSAAIECFKILFRKFSAPDRKPVKITWGGVSVKSCKTTAFYENLAGTPPHIQGHGSHIRDLLGDTIEP